MKSVMPQKAVNDQRYLTILTVVFAVAVFLITWYTIHLSRVESFGLIVEQGRALTESLAEASQNALTSESFYDHLARQRYSDLVTTLMDMDIDKLRRQDWASFSLTHDLRGIYLYAPDSGLVAGTTVRGARIRPPENVETEVDSLFQDPESRFVLMLEEGDTSDEMVHYYLELTSQLDRVIVIAGDAASYSQALQETGISRLARRMAREPGIEYIAFQTAAGVEFSSRHLDSLSEIAKDDFLSQALKADSVVQRINEYGGKRILELVRPFSAAQYQPGLFRVGLSLDRYDAVSRGYNQQLIIVTGVLLMLSLVAMAYIRGRRKRQDMVAEYERQALRRERLSEMGNLAAGVAHEIRNPLNTISIAAQRLAREFEPNTNREQYDSFTTQIRTETGRLNDIITRFLALARDDQRQRAVVRVDLLLKEVEALLKIEGDRLGIVVTVSVEPDLRLEADPDRLKELFLNLFSNTREALSGRTGSFVVDALREAEKIRITVTDDGPGIPREIRDKVFAPYYTSKQGGTGLGLPTAQRIVSDFGGEISLDETHASGTRFIILFPGQF